MSFNLAWSSFRMHSTADEFERNGCTLFKLEHAIYLLGPRDLAGFDAPGKTAGSAEPLAFREKRLTPLQRGFTLGAFDGDVGNVRGPRDELLLQRRWARWFVLIDGEGAQYVPRQRQHRRGRARSQAMGQCQGANDGRRPPRVRRNVRRDHLCLQARRHTTWSCLAIYGRAFNRIVEARGETGRGGVVEFRAARIDQINAAVTSAGHVLDKPAQRVEDIGKRTARRHHLEQPLLPHEQSLCPFSIINIGACAVPPHDLARFVTERLGANEKPAIHAIMAAKTRLDLV